MSGSPTACITKTGSSHRAAKAYGAAGKRGPVMEVGGYVALALVLVEVALIFFFVRGKTTKTAFVMASFTILFITAFFWMGNRVTEISIASVGTIKTAATLATQYVEDIKNIKSEADQQKLEITAAVTELKNEINEARGDITQLKARHITNEQREVLIKLLKPVQKAPVLFNPLMASGEAVQFSDEIKEVLTAAGFEASDVDFGESFFGFGRTGTFLFFKDKDNPPQHAKFIYEAFHRVGITLLGWPQPEFADPARLVIVVGTHP
jgi:ABC-type multidrug transport system fused ATPase/permease subunit